MKNTTPRIIALLWLGIICAIGFAQPLDMKLMKGMQARNIGPAGMSGRVTAIDVVHNEPDIIYAGTASGGLWKSESGGIDWEPLFDKEKVASIGALAIVQSNPNIIWAGTGEGNPRNSQTMGYGIYQSMDAGKTWQLKGLEKTRTIHRIIVHPDNPDVIFVGVTGTAWGETADRGVYKSTDGGASWQKVLFVNNLTGCADLVIDPHNPNKLVAAMWEYRRWPWFFKSGGAGSGIYVTLDGGKTWQKRTDKDGLPEGDLGRVGLAFARNNSNTIYATVEAKKNGLYRSDDGGYKWRLINDNKDEVGNRPFYYSEIYVDPSNENRIYNIFSLVTMSEDGGKSFKTLLPYSGVHPDHHAFWIHPTNPDYIIDGNDGGMAISRDKGKSWQFVENLPLAQYYHINVDNEMPYNVYGGMQDNGSWRGPAYVWREGGIRNSYFYELYFGDGFDVMPDPEQPGRYGYAMSQGGNLGRYDLHTGEAKFIRPVHPEGKDLRFNWNAGIAQDPFEPATIYYGSQFLHKSTNKGDTWEIISPDLTSNDPEKQKQDESGGLTYDVTAAENHTTIISVAPSPVQKGVIWVGTDDGNVQLTRDGGKTWINLIDKIAVPKGSWVPHIHPSTYKAEEAFVVINNYRREDWNPYVFRTRNYGQTWERVVTEKQVWGYALSFVQDPIAPNLWFLGTEFGLYVSIDEGKNWTKWTQGYPTVATMDMKIQPREHDLAIATFGRAAFILDDIRPIREIALKGTAILNKEIHAFEPPTAVLASIGQAMGVRFAADAIYGGQNRPFGAMLSYSVKAGKSKVKAATDEKEKSEAKPQKVKIEIFDAQNKLIRTLSHEPDSGINRIYWGLNHKGVRFPGSPKPRPDAQEPGGPDVTPGKYKVRFTYNKAKDSTFVEVIADPREKVTQAGLEANLAAKQKYLAEIALATEAADRFIGAKETIELIQKQIPAGDTSYNALKKLGGSLLDSLKAYREYIVGKEDAQGIVRNPHTLQARLSRASGYLNSSKEGPSPTHNLVLQQVSQALDTFLKKSNRFFETTWADYRKKVEAAKLNWFKEEFKPVMRK